MTDRTNRRTDEVERGHPSPHTAHDSPNAVGIRRCDVLAVALLLLVGGVTLFYRLGACTLSSHEAYAAVPAREMLATGDWVVPRFGELPRLNKPPLGYWILAATAAALHDMSEATLRLPSAVSAALLAVLVGVWAGRWYGRTAGYGAALIQLTSVWVVTYGRKAEVDMLLCLLTTAALSLIAGHATSRRGERHESRSRVGHWPVPSPRWTAIYALLAAAWLAKFHYGPALVLAVPVAYLLVQRRPGALRALASPVGLMLLAAAVVVWPSMVLQTHPEAWSLWWTETVGRAFGELRPRPVWYYPPKLLWLTLPWTPVIAAAVLASWRRAWKAGDARERFLWVWLLSQFAIVSLSANKHTHYLFAALPAFSLLGAQGASRIVDWARQRDFVLPPRWLWVATGVSLAGLVAACGAVTWLWPSLVVESTAMCAAAGTAVIAAACLSGWQRARPAASMALAACLIVYGGVVGWIVPGRDQRRDVAAFAENARSLAAARGDVCAYRVGQHGVVFYLGCAAYRRESPAALAGDLARNGEMLLVTHPEHVPELRGIGTTQIVAGTPGDGSADRRDSGALVLVRLRAPQAWLAN